MGHKREALEIKAPAPWTHVGYLLEGPGREYKQQVQGQLWVGEFDIVHFYAFHPQMPAVYLPVTRDEAFIEKLKVAVEMFLFDLENETKRCRAKGIFVSGHEHEVMPDELPGVFPWRQDVGGMQ